MKLLLNGEKIEENDQRLLMDNDKDQEALDEGIIVWKQVEQSLIGQTYSMKANGIIRRYD